MSYRDDLEIDKNNLDREWVEQSQKFCDWAEKEVEAEFRVNKAKSKLELVKSQLDSEIRSQAGHLGKKITEVYISNAILQRKEYQSALDEYYEALRVQGKLDVGRKAFEHRKKALEKLTDLFLSNYWSEPRGKATQLINQGMEHESDAEALNSNPRLKNFIRRT